MPYNFLPSRTNIESIGSSAKRWLKGWFKYLSVSDYVDVTEMSAPSAPSTNVLRLYVADSAGTSKLYTKDSAGAVVDLSTAGGGVTLDGAYDFGGAGSGKAVTVDSGAVALTNNAANNNGVLTLEKTPVGAQSGNLLTLTMGAQASGAALVISNSGSGNDITGSGSTWSITKAGVVTGTQFALANGDFSVSDDGVITVTPDGSPAACILVSPGAAATTGLDVSDSDLTNAISVGDNVILGGAASINFTNFDVDAAGNVTAASISAGIVQMDALTPASAAPTTITLDGAGTGGVTIGGTSTGTITLGGGSTLVNLPSGTDMVLAGGDLTVTDTANADCVTFTNNTLTTADLLTLSATGTRTSNNVIAITDGATTASTIAITANTQTSGNGIQYGNTGAALTGAAIRLNVTDGAGFTGYYLQCYDGAADDFSVKRYGATVIGGLASTDMLTITAGDLQLTAGDIDVDLGIITVDNTADEGNKIARNNAVGTAAVLEIEQAHATGGIGLLVDQKSTTAAHYGIDMTSAGGTHLHLTANGAAGDGILVDVTDAHTGQILKIDAGPWLGTAGEGAALDFRSDGAATSEAGHAIYIKMQGTGVDAAAIDGKGLYIEDEAAATAGSYLVKLDTLANTALHISNAGAAADGIKFDVANSYTGQGIVADLGPWLGTSGEGFIDIASDNAATVPAGQYIRCRQLGTGQHAAAIGGTILYMEDDAAAPAAGTSYVMKIDATNIEAIHVDTGKVLVDETVTATGGLSSGTAADSFIYTDTVEISNAELKDLVANPKTLVASPGANKFVELVNAVLILDYGSEVLTVNAGDNLVIQYNTSGQDATAAIETDGFLTAAADTVCFVNAAGIATVPAANVVDKALELFNVGVDFGGNASADTTLTVKVSYRIHADGL